jgi:hypothetical protein
MVVVPFKGEYGPTIKMDYPIAMGVRRGEKEWKEKVETLLEKNKANIKQILTEYGVPLVEKPKAAAEAK